ncbi:MAG TPA: DUF1559 domain-containing protein [Thermoguttaceae bacterium]|nr:DUF1559 domain-containing protein [Thermoguttaceae bacterium]
MAAEKPRAGGFTLVELLVVIAIIGVLVGMIMPAVQAARESARSTTCQNNLKNVATAIQSHETSQGYYPSSGWGEKWTGDPDMGYGHSQPGGWIYSILPGLGMENVHKLGEGVQGTGKQNYLKRQMEAVVNVLICPSRRRAMSYPATVAEGAVNAGGTPQRAAKTDYAINSGTVFMPVPGPDLSFLTDYRKKTGDDWTPKDSWIRESFNGISGPRTQIRSVDDGEGNTYLVGEKNLNPLTYLTGTDPGDNNSMYQGFGRSANRWTSIKPQQDITGASGSTGFGSAHSSGFHMAMCDYSVRPINFSIDPGVHGQLGSRNDGVAVDQAEWQR